MMPPPLPRQGWNPYNAGSIAGVPYAQGVARNPYAQGVASHQPEEPEPFDMDAVHVALSMQHHPNPQYQYLASRITPLLGMFEEHAAERVHWQGAVDDSNAKLERLRSDHDIEEYQLKDYSSSLAMSNTRYKAVLKQLLPLQRQLLHIVGMEEHAGYEAMSISGVHSLEELTIADESMAQRPLDVTMDTLETIRVVWQVPNMSLVRSNRMSLATLDDFLSRLKGSVGEPGIATNPHFIEAHNGNPPRIKVSGTRPQKEEQLQLYIKIPDEE